MSTSDITLLLAGSVAAGGFRLARYWLRLRFLRHSFDRNGDRRDLEVAGKVTATANAVEARRPCRELVRRS